MTKHPVEILGIRMHFLSIVDLNHIVRKCITRSDHAVIAHVNLHAAYLYRNDREFRTLYQSAYCLHIDGMSLVFLARLLGYRVSRDQRVTYVDWILPLLQEALRHHWRIFYLGSEPGVARKGALILQEKLKGLEILTHHGYFDDAPGSSDNQHIVSEINAFKPNILLVGMGMPRQERWILNHFSALEANVIMNSGGCMDYVAGVVPTPPRWLAMLGLEWLCRFLFAPRRMWRRCVLEPVCLFPPFLNDVKKRLVASRSSSRSNK